MDKKRVSVLIASKLVLNITIGTILACAPVSSYCARAKTPTIKPFIGLDVGTRTLKFEEGAGKDNFANNFYHISPYVGLQLNNNIGFQVGYETSNRSSNLKLYGLNDAFLGVPPAPTVPGGQQTMRFLSKTKIRGEYLGFYVNTNNFWQKYSMPIELSLFAGIANLKTMMSNIELTGNGYGNPLPIYEDLATSKKACPKITVTAKFFIPKTRNKLSFKISYGWEKTSNLSAQIYTMAGNLGNGAFASPPLMVVKLKNSYHATIGLNYSLL